MKELIKATSYRIAEEICAEGHRLLEIEELVECFNDLRDFRKGETVIFWSATRTKFAVQYLRRDRNDICLTNWSCMGGRYMCGYGVYMRTNDV